MSDPIELITRAEAAHQQAGDLKREVERMLQEALAAYLKPGVFIDLNRLKGMPEHLRSVKTMAGNDRGTRLFLIESEPRVEVSMGYIELAKWRCKATPISEKTGKPMSGASHGANSVALGGQVELLGHLFSRHLEPDDGASPEQERQIITKRIERFVNEARVEAAAAVASVESPVATPSAASKRATARP